MKVEYKINDRGVKISYILYSAYENTIQHTKTPF